MTVRRTGYQVRGLWQTTRGNGPRHSSIIEMKTSDEQRMKRPSYGLSWLCADKKLRLSEGHVRYRNPVAELLSVNAGLSVPLNCLDQRDIWVTHYVWLRIENVQYVHARGNDMGVKATRKLTDEQVWFSLRSFLGSAGLMASKLKSTDDIMWAAHILFSVPKEINDPRDMREYIRNIGVNKRRSISIENMKAIPAELRSTAPRNAARLDISLSGTKLPAKQLRAALRERAEEKRKPSPEILDQLTDHGTGKLIQ